MLLSFALAHLRVVLDLRTPHGRQFKAFAAKAQEQRRREKDRRSRVEGYLRRAIEETDETRRKFASQRAVYWTAIAEEWNQACAKKSERLMKRADFLR